MMNRSISFIVETDDNPALDMTTELGNYRIEVVGVRDKANLPVICWECSKKRISKMLRRIAFVIKSDHGHDKKLRGRICVECGRAYFKNNAIKQLVLCQELAQNKMRYFSS